MTKQIIKDKKSKKQNKKFHKNEALNNVLQILVDASSSEVRTFSKKQKQVFVSKILNQAHS